MRRNRLWLIIIVALAIFALWVSLPDNAGIVIDSDGDGTPEVNFNLRRCRSQYQRYLAS